MCLPASMALMVGANPQTDQRGEHNVHLIHGDHIHQSFGTAVGLDACSTAFAELVVTAFVADDHTVGFELTGLGQQQVGVAASGEYFYTEGIRMGADNVERLGSDGSCGSEDGNFDRCIHGNSKIMKHPRPLCSQIIRQASTDSAALGAWVPRRADLQERNTYRVVRARGISASMAPPTGLLRVHPRIPA